MRVKTTLRYHPSPTPRLLQKNENSNRPREDPRRGLRALRGRAYSSAAAAENRMEFPGKHTTKPQQSCFGLPVHEPWAWDREARPVHARSRLRRPLGTRESKRTTRAQRGIIRPLRRKSCHLTHFEDLVPATSLHSCPYTCTLGGRRGLGGGEGASSGFRLSVWGGERIPETFCPSPVNSTAPAPRAAPTGLPPAPSSLPTPLPARGAGLAVGNPKHRQGPGGAAPDRGRTASGDPRLRCRAPAPNSRSGRGRRAPPGPAG